MGWASGQLVRTLAIIVFVAGVFASYQDNKNDTSKLDARDRAQCERGNAVRRTIDVLVESQIADLRTASAYAANQATRAQYEALLVDTQDVIHDPEVAELMVQLDCDKL